MAILTPGKTDPKTRNIIRNRELFHDDKGSVQQEVITTIIVYAPSIRHEQKLIEVKWQTDN